MKKKKKKTRTQNQPRNAPYRRRRAATASVCPHNPPPPPPPRRQPGSLYDNTTATRADPHLQQLGDVVGDARKADDGGGGGDERRAGVANGLAGLHVVLCEAGTRGAALGAGVLLALFAERRGEGVDVAAVHADVGRALPQSRGMTDVARSRLVNDKR